MSNEERSIGWIEVITGPMFAGKSEELLRRINRLKYAKKNFIVFKPKIDDRYSETDVVSHEKKSYKAHPISKGVDILKYITRDLEVVCIDEVQFFDEGIIDVVETLANRGIRVICAGLDTDFKGDPFPVVANLLARAEIVVKLTAICAVCGKDATRTQRLIDGKPARADGPVILVGATESYEPRCRHCHQVDRK